MKKLNPETREKLLQISTATLSTCLFKRGFRNLCLQNVFPLKKGKGNMVGEAYTLRYIPAREDLNSIKVFEDLKHPQRVAIEECPEGSILVIDSRKDARAASAGSILITRLMKRGVAGIVTDGGFRDSGEIELLSIPSYHQRASIATNLILHQAIALNEPIGCGDVAVFPGDIIVGDDEGVIVIPQEIADEVAEESMRMTLFEAFVMEEVQSGKSIFGIYPPIDPDTLIRFENWKK